MDINVYNHIRSGGAGFIEMPRGLFAVSGKEAIQFLDGMITNDMKTLAGGAQMLAAFPNAQGRLLAVVRILRQGDRFLIETEEATREKVFNNLFRFTFAGDFFVEDLSEFFRYFEVFEAESAASLTAGLRTQNATSDTVGQPTPAVAPASVGSMSFTSGRIPGYFVPSDAAGAFKSTLQANGAAEISADLFETLRIESGIPKYGIDMDENTIVPELGLDGMISYTKGCYIGQEIIARIHFRGHVAKQLAGLIFDQPAGEQETRPAGSMPQPGNELATADGKNAGRITSVAFSPKLGSNIALAFVRYDYLAAGTKLDGGDLSATVSKLPFVD
jgi:folate-binding protein YgfZ